MLAEKFRRWKNSFILFALVMLFGARRLLRKVARNRTLARNAAIEEHLRSAETLRRERAFLDGENSAASELLGARWASGRPNWGAIHALMGWVASLRDAVREAGLPGTVAASVADAASAGGLGAGLSRADRDALLRMTRAHEAFEQQVGTFAALIEMKDADLFGKDASPGALDGVVVAVERWQGGLAG